MQGSTEQQQITLISQLCGSITPDLWPGVERLELFNKLELPKGQKRKVGDLNQILPKANSKILTYAMQALL
jgi:cyclin-dependent kinase 9